MSTSDPNSYHNDEYKPLPSPSRNIYNSLIESSHDKWGWLIYRTTYADDAAWDRFKAFDKEKFDGATREGLRAHFAERAEGAYGREQPRATDTWKLTSAARYRYFLQVDEEAVVEFIAEDPTYPDLNHDGGSHVKLIKVEWEPDVEADPEEIAYEVIDGLSQYDVGWMEIGSPQIGIDLYEPLSGPEDAWSLEYLRPPGMFSG
ncbi:hypothetical protein BDZ85DRAFT_313690 [Elsinoe ampelina]|uniref:Uncharacterized protein n=1 Tax=Elsinoe ampelina TaxID=302913 RepID=A0A6A6GA66_9PEZI|nr:hypothetical protein BDZ85DRAFT_313690 [Elsinoe ampelina]